MQITDGTTTLTFTGTRFDDFTVIEQSSTRTGGGDIKSIRSGRRFKVLEGIRSTGDEWETLSELLTNGATSYWYTPTNTPDYLDSTDFPMRVSIDIPKKSRHVGGGSKRYYIELSIQGVSLL